MEETQITHSHIVKTDTFEGPLELLLSLVEGRKLFINEISLVSVTDDFLREARALPKHNLSELTSFLAIAATLILIKSRSLLPGFLVTREEEKDIKDLESRLAIYALMREVSTDISQRYGVQVMRMSPERSRLSVVFAPDSTLTSAVLAHTMNEVLSRVPKEEVLPEVRVRKIISIEEVISDLTTRVASAMRVSFNQWKETLGGEDAEAQKKNVIVSFLAMLELVRQGTFDALQGTDFQDIELISLDTQNI